MCKIGSVDLSIIILYIIFVLYVGLKNSSKVITFKYYAVGRNNLSVNGLTYTIFATICGGNFLFGSIGFAYKYGTSIFLKSTFFVLAYILAGWLFSLHKYKYYGKLSIGDVMSDLYGKNAGIISGIASALRCFGAAGIQMTVFAKICQYFLNIPFEYCAIVFFLIIVSYVSFSGVDSVVRTDVLQFVALTVAVPFVLNVSITNIGGMYDLISKYTTNNAGHITSWFDDDNLIALSILGWVFRSSPPPPVFSRALMSVSGVNFRKAMMRVSFLILLFHGIFFLIGVSFRELNPDLDHEQMLLYTVNTFLPVGVKSIVVIGFLAMVMSSVDSYINTAAISIGYDIIKPLSKNDKTDIDLVRSVRIITCIFSIILLYTVLKVQSVYQILDFAVVIWVSIVVLLYIGLLGVRSNKISFYAGFFSSCSMIIFLSNYDKSLALIGTCSFSIIANIVAFFAAHYIQKYLHLLPETKDDSEKVNEVKQFIKDDIVKNSYVAKIIKLCKDLFTFNYQRYLREYFLNNGSNCSMFSCFILINSVLPFFMCDTSIKTDINLLYMHFIIGILNTMILFRSLMPAWYSKRWEIFFLIDLIVSLPFYCSFMLFLRSGTFYWHISFVISMFIMAYVLDIYSFIFAMIVGAVGGYYAAITISNGIDFNVFFDGFNGEVLYMYVFAIVISIMICVGRKDIKNATRINAYKTTIGIISHETLTPLMFLKTKFDKILKLNKKSDSDLFDTKIVDIAKDGNTMIKSIFNFYDMFLQNVRIDDDVSNFKVVTSDAYSIVKNIVDEYPIHKANKGIIHVELVENFNLVVNQMLLKHVLYNLIKNALFFVSGRENPNITIKIVANDYKNYNNIIVSDNGIGMKPSVQSNVFAKFYTKRLNGTGLGLFFCKRAMYSMYGDITCISEYGIGTDFILMFPKKSVFDKDRYTEVLAS